MTSFDQALADTLFPGEGVLPAASRAGVSLAALDLRHRQAIDAIARAAGGEAAFAAAGEPARMAAVRAADKSEPQAFQALVLAVSALYHSSPAVLEAYGWPFRAPQPAGFAVGGPGDEAETARLLERVRARPPLWRSP